MLAGRRTRTDSPRSDGRASAPTQADHQREFVSFRSMEDGPREGASFECRFNIWSTFDTVGNTRELPTDTNGSCAMTSTDLPDRFTFTSRDGLGIVACKWLPDTPPRGIVQLTHGMGEHVLRYSESADALRGAGYIVCGQDHRGHGATAAASGGYGVIGAGGWGELVNDIHLLNKILREQHPGLPVTLLAHSMGSFAAQQYLLDYSDEISAAFLTGTGLVDLIEPTIDLNESLSLEMFNAPFAPARTAFDWLSRDEARAYLDDPQCGFGLDIPATQALFAAGRALADPHRVAAIRSDLPVFIAVGDDDPVNARLTLVHPLIDRLIAAGLGNVTLKVYRGARHELFNETIRTEVIHDLIEWLAGVASR